MAEENPITKQLERIDFAGTTLINATVMALPYLAFLGIVFGGIGLLLNKIIPKQGGNN